MAQEALEAEETGNAEGSELERGEGGVAPGGEVPEGEPSGEGETTTDQLNTESVDGLEDSTEEDAEEVTET